MSQIKNLSGFLNFQTDGDAPAPVAAPISSAQVPVVHNSYTVKQIVSGIIIDAKYDLSDQDVDAILAISFEDGTPLLSLGDKKLLYNIVWYIIARVFGDHTSGEKMKQLPLSDVIKELEDLVDNHVEKHDIMLDSQAFAKERTIYVSETDRLRSSIAVIQGSVQCPKCYNYKTMTVFVQMRGGDEPMTQKNKCFACGFSWSIGS
jgi:DNA-directed RNA polymerase subunit M/transcription elongation factor TFIIS